MTAIGGERHYGCRVYQNYTYKNLRVLFLENELLRIGIYLDKGSDIFQFQYKPLDVDFMWHSPLPIPDQPFFITSPGESGSFQDCYEGGWQEIFPNGGALFRGNGVLHGQHGEVWGLPWNVDVEINEPEKVEVCLNVRTRRTPFYLEKRLGIRSGLPILEISEKVINEGGESMEVMWGHHVSFGPPFLSGDCLINIPANTAEVFEEPIANSRFAPGKTLSWPFMRMKTGDIIDAGKVPPPNQDIHDMLFLKELTAGWYALTNTVNKVGFALQWDYRVFPYIWYWAVSHGLSGYPWYRRTYNIALEPFSSIPAPLPKASARGTTLKIAPGCQVELAMKAIVYTGFTSVLGIDGNGKVSGM